MCTYWKKMALNINGTMWEQAMVNKHELAFAGLVVMVMSLAILWYNKTVSSCGSGSSTPPLPPGPKGLPVVGYFPFLGPNLHHEFAKMANRYGPIFKLYLGSKLHIVVNSAELAKVVTGEQDESFANRDPHTAGLATSYNANDVAWAPNNADRRNLRKVLVHEVLSNVNLDASHSYRRDEVRKTVKNVYDRIGTPVDINEISFSTVLETLTGIVWGKGLVEGSKYSNLSDEIRKVVSSIVEIAEGLNISDFFPALARFDFQGVKRKMDDQMKQFDRIFETTIEERTLQNKRVSLTDKTEEQIKQEGKKDFLQILLELKDQKTGPSITMTQLKALVVDIFLGGTDATSAMVEWAMTEILRNKEVMKKVQNELEEIVGLDNVVEESHIPKLKYLDAVFKETFRLHPPLPFLLPRAPNKTCTVGGYTVPKGATIFLNVWAIQRDPKYWDNPSEFLPERFLNNEGLEKWDYSGTNPKFFPFGSGRRKCPGIPLGEKMMTHILASLMHSFEWSLPEGEELDLYDKFGIAMKKKNPLVVIPSPRLRDANLYK
ncbi:putative cytochrome P450 [Helianthus debilis subsp. tardiflorus]